MKYVSMGFDHDGATWRLTFDHHRRCSLVKLGDGKEDEFEFRNKTFGEAIIYLKEHNMPCPELVDINNLL